MDKYIIREEDFVIVVSIYYGVVRATRKSIRLDHSETWSVKEFEAKLGKEKAPLGLLAVEFLGGSEVHQILVIRKNYCGERETMKVMAPDL